MFDCPANVVFLDSYYVAHDATPVKIENTFCIFENYAANIMWPHWSRYSWGTCKWYYFVVVIIVILFGHVIVLYDNYMHMVL